MCQVLSELTLVEYRKEESLQVGIKHVLYFESHLYLAYSNITALQYIHRQTAVSFQISFTNRCCSHSVEAETMIILILTFSASMCFKSGINPEMYT